ncbi:MAG TPA: alpha/beta fold hydrolase [Planctomycetota bacterium]|nr:alpha/beta fold hydrolase [Planctomycetota bacterium]
MRLRVPSLATLVLLGLVAVPVVALAEAWEREFAANIESTDSNVQYLAVTRLDPANAKAREYLYAVAGSASWHVREGCIETLAKAPSDAIEDLRKNMKSHKNPASREAIVYALGAMKSLDRVPDLIEALQDKAPEVRRAAALEILENPTKEGVSAIIEAWKREHKKGDWTVEVYYKDVLEKLTKNFFGWQIQDWENWWLAKADKWKPPKPKKEKQPGEEGGKDEGKKGEDASDDDKQGGEGKEKPAEETTTLRDVELTIKESGKGGPLFVLPELYRNKLYMEKHLQSIEADARLFYIDLPPMSKFRGLKNLGNSGRPYYPLDMVCDAFDELRKERKQDHIAIMGHGMAAWVAMRYATKYPKNVSHLILVSTWSSSKAWDDGRKRIEVDGKTHNKPEEEHFAKNKVADPNTNKAEYEPKDPQEAEALARMGWTTLWADQRNILASQWFKPTFVDMGGMWIPEFDVGKEKGNPVPTMLVYGSRSLWVSPQDMKALNKYYPNSTVLECPNSADMPFIEDHALFTKAVKEFFKKHPFPRKSGK